MSKSVWKTCGYNVDKSLNGKFFFPTKLLIIIMKISNFVGKEQQFCRDKDLAMPINKGFFDPLNINIKVVVYYILYIIKKHLLNLKKKEKPKKIYKMLYINFQKIIK